MRGRGYDDVGSYIYYGRTTTTTIASTYYIQFVTYVLSRLLSVFILGPLSLASS